MPTWVFAPLRLANALRHFHGSTSLDYLLRLLLGWVRPPPPLTSPPRGPRVGGRTVTLFFLTNKKCFTASDKTSLYLSAQCKCRLSSARRGNRSSVITRLPSPRLWVSLALGRAPRPLLSTWIRLACCTLSLSTQRRIAHTGLAARVLALCWSSFSTRLGTTRNALPRLGCCTCGNHR